MKTLPLIPTLLLTIAIVWLPGVAAATPAPPRSPVPLAKFLERSAHIELHTSNAQQTVFLPISPRHRVLRATLHVEFTSSIALKDDRSLLRVGLSDRIIAQLPIRHKNPNGVYDIELPTRLFEPGYVPLTFWVAQHYTFRFEDPSAPELFTQIDVDRSTLTLDVEPIALDPTLAELDDLIDSRLWDDYDLTVVTPSQVDDDRLEPAALVTQGAALRLRFKPLTVHHALVESPSEPRREGRFPGIDATSFGGRDAVLIGTAQELVGLVDDALIRDIDGSFLGIYPQDAAPHRFVLVVSGTDPESLLEAARAFASSSMPLPDTASTRIDAIDELDVQPGTAHHVVHQNRTYRFADLDFRTTTLQGMSAPSIEIDVWVPPDLYALETANVELSLHFAYGAALRRDSTFQVYLNDRFERAIYLRNESGDVFRDYKVQIPLRSFLAYGGGVNRLRFTPVMMPLVTGECEAIQDRNLTLTVFDDSTLTVPAAAHFAELPDLRRFARTVFPFGQQGHRAGLTVQLLDRDPETLGAAWTLLAKMAQVRTLPLSAAELTFVESTAAGDHILIGPTPALREAMLVGAPFGLGDPFEIPHAARVTEQPEENPDGFLGRFWRLVRQAMSADDLPSDRLLRPETVSLRQTGALGSYSLMMAYQSPWRSEGSVVVLTADDTAGLHRGTRQLIDPGTWDHLAGDVVVWREEPDTLRSLDIGPSYYVGGLGLLGRLSYSFSRSPWLWTGALVVLMLAFTALVLRFLNRQETNRTSSSSGPDGSSGTALTTGDPGGGDPGSGDPEDDRGRDGGRDSKLDSVPGGDARREVEAPPPRRELASTAAPSSVITDDLITEVIDLDEDDRGSR